MSQSKSVRRSLAAALALALSAPAFAGQVHTSGLTESGSFDRFIVRYASGTPEALDAGARQRALDGAGRAEGVALSHQLRLAVGADVVLVGDGATLEAHALVAETIGYELACGIRTSGERSTREVVG